jgi:hypothetical protein
MEQACRTWRSAGMKSVSGRLLQGKGPALASGPAPGRGRRPVWPARHGRPRRRHIALRPVRDHARGEAAGRPARRGEAGSKTGRQPRRPRPRRRCSGGWSRSGTAGKCSSGRPDAGGVGRSADMGVMPVPGSFGRAREWFGTVSPKAGLGCPWERPDPAGRHDQSGLPLGSLQRARSSGRAAAHTPAHHS